MTKVTSWSQLAKELERAKNKALEDSAKKAVEVVKDEIDKEVYSIPAGGYERTGDLRNSMTDFPLESKGNKSEVKIAHDSQSMSYDSSKFQHASPYWSPRDYRRYVAETVHDGTSGNLFGEHGHWHERKPYMDNAKKRMSEGEYKKFMRESLEEQGYKTK